MIILTIYQHNQKMKKQITEKSGPQNVPLLLYCCNENATYNLEMSKFIIIVPNIFRMAPFFLDAVGPGLSTFKISADL